MTTRADRGRDVVRRVFGGALYQQGRGFYSALEFLAIARGELELETVESASGKRVRVTRVLPAEGPATYRRSGHDHARRLLADGDAVVSGVFNDSRTREAVANLLQGLEAPVPGRRAGKHPWKTRHLWPYPPEAIHYDAVERRGKVQIERYAYRGAGALAHRILCTDPNGDRLDGIRDGLRALLADDGGAVGMLLTALARHDKATPDEAFVDQVEARSLGGGDEVKDPEGPLAKPTRSMEGLREGTHRLLTREELSPFERIDDLVHWIPWCIACHQLEMARRQVGRNERAPLVFDAGHGKSRVRNVARRLLGASIVTIREALHDGARRIDAPELLRGNSSWWSGSRTFYATTLYAVGALNANTGRRHYELGPSLLQAIVHALVDDPIDAERFFGEILGNRLGIVCDPASAASHERLGIDNRDLRVNGERLAERLDDVGLSRSFSDSTRMIGIHE